MKLSVLFTLAGLVATSLQDGVNAPDVSELVSATGGKNATGISSDQLHEGILAVMDSDLVVHSDNLHEYFSNNHGANHTIYVNDTRVFIDMSQVEKKLNTRQVAK